MPRSSIAVEARGITKRFREVLALDDVTVGVAPGAIHALLGLNGAGKTTFLRVVAGLTDPTTGEVIFRQDGRVVPGGWEARHLVGVLPAGDRSFYLRLTGVENIAFFARLHGYRRKASLQRARELLDIVGLSDAADRRVGLYSQGMKQRLAAARAFISDPPLLIVDEATHDLDPEGARTVRELVAGHAARGRAVLWATQRLEEIRGFAHEVTVLHRGRTRFQGSVDQLLARSVRPRYVLRLQSTDAPVEVGALVGGIGELEPLGDGEHHRLTLAEGAVLGDALARLLDGPVRLLACREERSEVEEAFLVLTEEHAG